MRFCLTFREEPRHMQIWHIELSSFETERVLAVPTRFRPMQLSVQLQFWMRFRCTFALLCAKSRAVLIQSQHVFAVA